MAIGGTRAPDHFHRELGKIIWDYCGMDRNANGLEKALSEIPALHEEFKKDLKVTGSDTNVNQTLEKAGRVDDFFELGMLMCKDALNREESCGGHFRSDTRPTRARRCATTTTSRTSAPGSGPATWPTPSSTRNLSNTKSSTSRHGATSEHPHQSHPQDLASGRPDRTGPFREPSDRPRSVTRRRSSRCSTSSTSGSSRRARRRSSSTTTVVRASAERAR